MQPAGPAPVETHALTRLLAEERRQHARLEACRLEAQRRVADARSQAEALRTQTDETLDALARQLALGEAEESRAVEAALAEEVGRRLGLLAAAANQDQGAWRTWLVTQVLDDPALP